jgi:hypothetical protein
VSRVLQSPYTPIYKDFGPNDPGQLKLGSTQLSSQRIGNQRFSGCNKHRNCWSSYRSDNFLSLYVVIYDVFKILLPMQLFGSIPNDYDIPMVQYVHPHYDDSIPSFGQLLPHLIVLLIRPQMFLWVFMLLMFLVFCFSFCCYFNLTLTRCNIFV